MTGGNDRPEAARLALRHVLSPLFALAALAGCAHEEEAKPAQTTAFVYSADLQGAAKLCTAPQQLTPPSGQPAAVSMVVGNDGGWCGIGVADTAAHPYPEPYAAGLLTGRPAHGKVYVHTVGHQTRIDYTPDRAFAGADRFTVALLPGDAALHVSVSVQASAAPPAPAPSPPHPARPVPKRK